MNIEDTVFCSVDIETTGLDPERDEILAVACIPIRCLKISVSSAYYTLVHPRKYCIDSMKYHGISPGDLETAPTFKEVAQQVLTAMDGILVGYSVDFDYVFLRRHFRHVGLKLKRDLLDIAAIERWIREQQASRDRDFSLEGIMASYGLRQCYRHHATADAFFAAQIFQMQVLKLLRLGVHTTRKLIRIARCRWDDGSTFAF